MSGYLRDRGFVLEVKPYREADAWVSLWTERHGKQEAFAAGLRRTNAKQQGHVQPFAVVEVMLAHGKAFDRVTVARMTAEHGFAVRRHPAWNVVLASLGALCARLAPVHVDEPRVFSFFLEILRLAEAQGQPFSFERVWLVWAFCLHALAGLFGYRVSLVRCARCGASPVRRLAFSVKDGGFLCATCDADPATRTAPFKTPEAVLEKGLAFLEGATVADVLRRTASKQALLDLATILEATLIALPVDDWRKQKRYLERMADLFREPAT